MTGIDVMLLCENLKLTPTQRMEKRMALQRLAAEVRRSGVAPHTMPIELFGHLLRASTCRR